MPRTTFGETLQHLFRDHALGRIPTVEFETRERFLLTQSKWRLPAFVPDWRREFILAAFGAAIAVVAILFMRP